MTPNRDFSPSQAILNLPSMHSTPMLSFLNPACLIFPSSNCERLVVQLPGRFQKHRSDLFVVPCQPESRLALPFRKGVNDFLVVLYRSVGLERRPRYSDASWSSTWFEFS